MSASVVYYQWEDWTAGEAAGLLRLRLCKWTSAVIDALMPMELADWTDLHWSSDCFYMDLLFIFSLLLYWSYWSSSSVADLHWLELIFVGWSWSSLAGADLHCLELIFIVGNWSSLSGTDLHGPVLRPLDVIIIVLIDLNCLELIFIVWNWSSLYGADLKSLSRTDLLCMLLIFLTWKCCLHRKKYLFIGSDRMHLTIPNTYRWNDMPILLRLTTFEVKHMCVWLCTVCTFIWNRSSEQLLTCATFDQCVKQVVINYGLHG